MLESERNLLVHYGKKLIVHRLTTGTGGNLSILDRGSGLIAITPTGIDYFDTRPDDIVVLELEGGVVEGRRKPSSELIMHRILYRHRTDINAIVHAHSTYATTLSCLNWRLPPVHYLVAFAGKDVKCAPYATFGTEELARRALAAMQDRKAVFLANHGLLAGGKDLATAFTVAEQVEFCAEIYCRCKCIGEPIVLPDAEMELLAEELRYYGQTRKQEE